MNQITTQYVTENGACYEQYVITDPAAKTSLTITPERGGMITGFTLDGDEYIWTRRQWGSTIWRYSSLWGIRKKKSDSGRKRRSYNRGKWMK